MLEADPDPKASRKVRSVNLRHLVDKHEILYIKENQRKQAEG